MKINAVILDFGGTLVDGGIEWNEYHNSLLLYIKSMGYPLKMRDMKKALRATLNELHKLREKGYERTFEEVYSDFLSRIGVPDDPETLSEIHQIYKNNYKTQYIPCVEEILKEISDHYQVALLSNSMSDQPHQLLERAGFNKYFDLKICSRDLGIRKPNPKIFYYVLKKLGVKPEETVHVGDSVEQDMEGAQGVGIIGIWIKSPEQPMWTGHKIASICDLPDYLRKIESS